MPPIFHLLYNSSNQSPASVENRGDEVWPHPTIQLNNLVAHLPCPLRLGSRDCSLYNITLPSLVLIIFVLLGLIICYRDFTRSDQTVRTLCQGEISSLGLQEGTALQACTYSVKNTCSLVMGKLAIKSVVWDLERGFESDSRAVKSHI